jgi:hypothetical protein
MSSVAHTVFQHINNVEIFINTNWVKMITQLNILFWNVQVPLIYMHIYNARKPSIHKIQKITVFQW